VTPINEHKLSNVRFQTALAKEFDGEFDLICMFDCLHDMGDPAGAAAHIRSCLKIEGTLMVAEPIAEDAIQDNINPVGRLYYAASTMVCVPTSLAQEVGTALGHKQESNDYGRLLLTREDFRIFVEQRRHPSIWSSKLGHSLE
jgi:hypothetical protein